MPRRPTPATASAYERQKERARRRGMLESRLARDIGDIPPVANSERKAKARRNFRRFCESYFPRRFTLAWSPDHLKVIAKVEQAVLRGGLFAMAMPRGGGKTTICEIATLWALVYGHHPFVMLIGNSEAHSLAMLANIKAELEHNDGLAEDFPEVCHAIRALEGQTRRCVGQLHHGRPTLIGWSADEITLPEIPGSRAAGAVVRVAGITGNIRGAVHVRPSGHSIRPSFVILDDPQTDESARSLSQVERRESVINGAVLNLAGPGRRIAAVMPCTVIQEDDLADRVLNRSTHPEWQGERTKLVYMFPTATGLWDEYARIRANSLAADGDGHEATDFYREHREEMDAGAVVAWPERHNPDELSAIQNAMNLLARDRRAFYAEYQNEPLPSDDTDEDQITAEAIVARTNGHRRRTAPLEATHLTMFVDVQAKALFWMVVAWGDGFTGAIIDYGTEPDQKQAYFSLKDIKRTLQAAAPRAGIEGAIYAGLERLTEDTLGREYTRDDGSTLRIDRCLIDANWGTSTDVVYKFARQSKHAVVLPAHGRYVGASSVPFSEYKRKPGDRTGLNWRIPAASGRRAVRHVVFDANFWKSHVHARLAVPMGDPGALTLWGTRGDTHRMLADHLTAEYRVRTEGRGRTVDEWKIRVAGADNHWLDCLAGCAVAASISGVALTGIGAGTSPRRPRVKLSELQRQKGHR